MTEAVIRKKAGMASVKDMPVLQDGPPPGGFAPVRFARRIPNKGPSAMAIFLAAFGAFSWGMYQVGKGNKIRRALKEEKYAARRAILPILQAEEDERFVKEWKKYLEEEARIMKDVPGWKVGESVYHSGRWMPPATGELRPDICFFTLRADVVSIKNSETFLHFSPFYMAKKESRPEEINPEIPIPIITLVQEMLSKIIICRFAANYQFIGVFAEVIDHMYFIPLENSDAASSY
ncbi:UNVERIFIED_CONTAM: NADH dehydrogenase ubiquinone 1 alpha subcomplex subunit 13-B [Sesamum indicum]